MILSALQRGANTPQGSGVAFVSAQIGFQIWKPNTVCVPVPCGKDFQHVLLLLYFPCRCGDNRYGECASQNDKWREACTPVPDGHTYKGPDILAMGPRPSRCSSTIGLAPCTAVHSVTLHVQCGRDRKLRAARAGFFLGLDQQVL